MHRKTFPVIYLILGILFISACRLSSTAGQSNPTQESTSPSLTQGPTVPASNELIDAALAKGDISNETALVYKVFAQFSDPRLPSVYKGSANISTDSHILDELQAQFSSLSPATQAAMIPFLIPPIYKGSWADPGAVSPSWAPSAPGAPSTPGREGPQDTPYKKPLPCDEINSDDWDYKSGMHSPVRFWFLKDRPEDMAIVDRFLVAMDDEIWPKLTGLMGKIPVPDGDVQCNGGSPDFDIYVTPDVARSSAPSIAPPGCRETPSYILLNPSVSNAILGHEFMHAIQWSFNTSADCMYPGEYAWMAEATASWSQDYVYPDDNEEQGYIDWFYAPSVPTLTLKNDSHEYGSYLFFFYLTHKFGQPGIVKTVWDNTTSMSCLEAVDKAIPGGFDEVWGEFAIENMIEPPYDEYQVWDQLNVKPSINSMSKYLVSPNKSSALPEEVAPLVIYYDWLTFSEDSRLITFFNGLAYELNDEPINTYMGTVPIEDGTTQYKFVDRPAEDIKGLKIQAYFKVAGDTDWQLEDWTNKPYVSFCRDASAERLTDLVIVISNSSQDLTIGKTGKYGSLVQDSNIGCWRYGGDASMHSTGEGDGGAFVDDQVIPNVAFERTEIHPDIPYPFLHFKVAEGQLDRTYDYASSDGDCVGSGEASITLSPASNYAFGNDLRRYAGTANTNQPITVNFDCPDGSGPQPIIPMSWFYVDVLSQINDQVYSLSDSGDMKGTGDLLEGVTNAQMLFKWNLLPLFESGSGGNSEPPPTLPAQNPSPGSSGGGSESTPNASLPEVPTYPNSETTQLVTTGQLFITTSDSVDKVSEFYKREFVNLGWTDGSDPRSTTATPYTMLVFIKDPMVATLMISNTDEKTMIMISVVNP
jgi:hypothetical protein